MKPVGGQAMCNRMIGLADKDLEIVSRSVAGVQAGALRHGHDRASWTHGNAGAKGLLTPSEADHVVVLGPFEKCVIGGVKDHQSTAAPNVVDESLLDLSRPARAAREMAAVEIVDHHVVPTKLRAFRPSADLHGEPPGTFQNGLDGAGAGSPIVVIHAVDDEGGELAIGGSAGDGKREKECEAPDHA
jgi:hypothetical protein